MKKLDQQTFFEKYNINTEDFNKTNLNWDSLCEIYEDFVETRDDYEEPAKYIINKLLKLKAVHSVRYRIKNPEHLIEKIIRKRINNPDRIIDIENYRNEITDIIGVRALYLFKKDYKKIHEYILKEWEQGETPTLYYRDGDSEDYIKELCNAGCEAKVHKFGYRSIHYLLETQPSKQKYFTELQIRTIFEEAWSEIDHEIRYPYYLNHPVFLNQLMILNRLSGTADEMSSFLKDLQQNLIAKDKEFERQIKAKDNLVDSISEKLKAFKNIAPDIQDKDGSPKLKKDDVNLNDDEIEFLTGIFSKIKGISRINIDTDEDGIPDTFIIDDPVKGKIIVVDKNQDGKTDYYVDL